MNPAAVRGRSECWAVAVAAPSSTNPNAILRGWVTNPVQIVVRSNFGGSAAASLTN